MSMKKNFFKFLLLGVFTLSLGAGFVGCKDYDDDIKLLEGEIAALKAELAGKATTADLSSLQGSLTALQNSLADYAKKTDAQGYATTAKAEAIAAAAADAASKVAALKSDLDVTIATLATKAALAETQGEVDALKAAYEAKIIEIDGEFTKISGQIEGILGAIETLEGDVEGLQEAVADLEAADITINNAITALDGKLEALKEVVAYKADVATQLTTLETTLREYAEELDEAQTAALNDVIDDLEEVSGELDALIARLDQTIADAITAALEEDGDIAKYVAAELENYVTSADFTAKVAELVEDIEANAAAITKINGELLVIKGTFSKRLTGLVIIPETTVSDHAAIVFNTLFYPGYGTLTENQVPELEEGYNDYEFFIAADAVVKYHLNPSTVVLGDNTYEFIADRQTNYWRVRSGEAAAPIEIKSMEQAGGVASFTVNKTDYFNTTEDYDIVALQATLGEKAMTDAEIADGKPVTVTSNYARLLDLDFYFYDLFISDKKDLAKGDNAHYALTFDAAKGKSWYNMQYDEVFDLKSLLATCVTVNGHKVFDIEAYGLTYKFSMPESKYLLDNLGTTTDQQQWIELVDAEAGTFKATGFNKEAIGRTPILRVDLVDAAGNIVTRAFVKVTITNENEKNIDVILNTVELTYNCVGTHGFEIDEETMRESVLRFIDNGAGISHEEFWNTYEQQDAFVKKNEVLYPMAAASTPKLIDGDSGVGTATKKVVWDFDHDELGSIGANGSMFVGTLILENKLVSSSYPKEIKFQFSFLMKLPTLAFNPTKEDEFWTKPVDSPESGFIVNIQVPSSPLAPASDAIFSTKLNDAWEVGKPIVPTMVTGTPGTCFTLDVRVVSTNAPAADAVEALAGVTITGATPAERLDADPDNEQLGMIQLAKGNAAIERALNSDKGLRATVEYFVTLDNKDEIVVKKIYVDFMKPVFLEGPSDLSFTDAEDDGDEVDLLYNGLLTDWRGYSIVAPWQESRSKEMSKGYWKLDCPDRFVDAHQVLVTPGYWDTKIEERTAVFATSTPTYQASISYRVSVVYDGLLWDIPMGTRTYTTTSDPNATFLTKDAAISSAMLRAADDLGVGVNGVLAERPAFVGWFTGVEYTSFNYILTRIDEAVITKDVIASETEIKYTVFTKFDYIRPVYKNVPGAWVSHQHDRKPNYPNKRKPAPAEYGFRDGCWVWTERTWTKNWTITTEGLYWNFYGEFKGLFVDFDGITTSLSHGSLPTNVTLELLDDGYTLKYYNKGAPITYEYEIHVPIYYNYGWGTVSDVVTIVVNPII